jgi:hypothetical protein
MFPKILLLFVLLNTISAVEYFSYQRNMIRNMSLRFLISCKYKKYKLAFNTFNNKLQEKINKMNENIKMKYMEMSCNYYSLTNEERYLMESILNLIY